ncbi:MAG: 3-dehydroquinate synthase [Oscillospiraceae bacterium]|nr:3-dehydroquinate synthase [Oscillospiraceae bacterium]
MITITVNSETGYNILIGKGLLFSCGNSIREVARGQKVLVISDTNVAPLYAQAVVDSLAENGFESDLFTFPAGETNKTLETVGHMLDAMSEFGLSRSDLVVALGGGVCGDLAGFASAIYLRGIDFVSIPTTLLAQIDSSVGGKTACDLESGKNLAGAFHNPQLIIIDPDCLSTLSERYFNDGIAEAIKYGCIKSKTLFNRLLTENPVDFIEDLIEECITIKKNVVENDFRENGERMLLNFGHTIGHAIEKYYNFSEISHGEAVGIGMVVITAAAEQNGLLEIGISDKITACLKLYSLPTHTTIPFETLADLAFADKKRRGSYLNLVLLHDIGESYIYKINTSKLESFFNGGL